MKPLRLVLLLLFAAPLLAMTFAPLLFRRDKRNKEEWTLPEDEK